MKKRSRKDKICCIMQPLYIPWIGYFDLIDRSDLFVFYDDVQLVRRSWCTRNRIKTSNGELILTVPIKKTDKRDNILYKNAKINNDEGWVKKHLKAIEMNYKKAPYFREVMPLLNELFLSKRYENLADLNISIIESIAKYMGIEKNMVRSSSIPNIKGKKDERLVDICNKLEVTRYLSPQGSADYIEEKNPGGLFPEAGLELFYQNFTHPEYDQKWGDFISHLSVIDAIMNLGGPGTLEKIREGQGENYHYKDFRKKFLNLS